MSSLSQTQTFHPRAEVKASPFLTVRLLHALAAFAETRGWWLFSAISVACGWVRLHTLTTRFLGHDELFTFYIAGAPSIRQLITLTRTVDLHPPLSYLLVRMSFAIFGANTWSCRLPFVVAFVVGAAALFWFVRRLLSSVHALVAVLFLWSNPFTYLADEARPYSMVLCFTVLMLVSWHWAIENPTRRRWALAILTASGYGLLLSHVLGVLPYGALLGAELIRLRIRRKADWPLWSALLAPAFCVITYIPLLRAHSGLLFAREYGVTPMRIFSFYWESIRYVATPLAVIGLLAFLWPRSTKATEATGHSSSAAISVPFGFLLASLAGIPLVIGIVFARSGTAFFDRYGVVWVIPFALVPTFILAHRTQRNQVAGICVALLLGVIFFFNTTGRPWLMTQVSSVVAPKIADKLLNAIALFPIYPPPNYPHPPAYLGASLATATPVDHLGTFEPELPLVAHTGLTFLELDRREPFEVTQRLYLLTDKGAAASIAHDTVFEHYEELTRVFPIRGKVVPYCAFASAHQRFLVVGDYTHPQGWLLRKLEQDGAMLRAVGTCRETTEGCQIYQVSLASSPCAQP